MGMLISSRSTSSGITSSYPSRRTAMLTVLPRGPRSRRTACSLLMPIAFSPSMRAMTSPARIPAR